MLCSWVSLVERVGFPDGEYMANVEDGGGFRKRMQKGEVKIG